MKRLILILGIVALISVIGLITMQKNITQKASPSSEKNMPTAAVRRYTLTDVERHSDAGSCWMIIEKKVYDVTRFIAQHPGGKAIIAGCGKDATAMFNNRGKEKEPHSDSARQMLVDYEIGQLD